ncbi:hypothetical protein BDFB_011644, partial [Asbolus verrucosus]
MNKEDLFVCNLDSPQGYQCDSCDVTHFKILLNNHMSDLHKKLEVNCDLSCVLKIHETKQKVGLKKHIMSKHTSPEYVKWFKCEHCSHKTIQKQNLQKHIIAKHSDLENIKWFQ